MKDKKFDHGMKGKNEGSCGSCGSSYKGEWKDKNTGSKKPGDYKHEGNKKGYPKQG